jgi:hypothetical protein
VNPQSPFRDSFSLGGWLLADLLLALAMLFLAANTVGLPPPLPSIDGFTPAAGGPGTNVTLTGQHLDGVQIVRFGDLRASVTQKSSTQIITSVPAGARTGPISAATEHELATSAIEFVVPLPATPTPVPAIPPTPTLVPTRTPASTSTPVPIPTLAPTPAVLALLPGCWSYTLNVAPRSVGSSPYDDQVRAELADLFAPVQGRRAGFVLTFARSTPDGDGTRVAQRINALLTEAAPDVFADARMKAYLSIGRAVGAVEIQVFYLPEVGVDPDQVLSDSMCRD